MKLIRVTTENKIDMFEFPTGTIQEQNEKLRELIGQDCELLEVVKPRGLYDHIRCSADPESGNAVCMLVDEEGLLKDLKYNYIGSLFYDRWLIIAGNVLFVGMERGMDGGIDICGIQEQEAKRIYDLFSKCIFLKERI